MGEAILGLFWLVVAVVGGTAALGVYALPTIIAIVRKRSDVVGIAVVDLVFFWVFTIGWWIALVWALLPENRRGPEVTVVQQNTTTVPPPAPVLPTAPLVTPDAAAHQSPDVSPHLPLPAHRPAQHRVGRRVGLPDQGNQYPSLPASDGVMPWPADHSASRRSAPDGRSTDTT